MPTTATAPGITVSEYLRIEEQSGEKHEYYDGKLRKMAGGSISHNRIAANLITELSTNLKGRPHMQVFGSDQKIYLPRFKFYLYADALVVAEEPLQVSEEAEAIINPILIAEVLSPSTEQRDRSEKFLYYRSLDSLKEYVLIRQDAPEILCLFRNAPDQWREQVTDGIEAKVKFASIDVHVALRDIYRKIF